MLKLPTDEIYIYKDGEKKCVAISEAPDLLEIKSYVSMYQAEKVTIMHEKEEIVIFENNTYNKKYFVE